MLEEVQRKNTQYYLIEFQGEKLGGVRVRNKVNKVFNMGPIFIKTTCQNKGIGYTVLQKLFGMYPQATEWELTTILQEKRNCHLYEKCGFVRVGDERQVNDRMTLIDYRMDVEKTDK